MGAVRLAVAARSGGARPLAGRVAVVAGATRGAGRGIAVRVDHGVEAEVIALFERVKADHGRLDVLVNDIWGGDPLTEWGTPFWRLDLATGRRMLDTAVWTHVITARHGAPLMVDRGEGLIIEVTDGDFYGYRGTLFYDLAKLATIRLGYAMAKDLEGTGVTALTVTPGFMRSEAVLDHFGVAESNWRDAVATDRHFAHSETPCFVGRAVAALAADPHVGAKAGGVHGSWTLAKEYGFDDIDCRRPDWGTHFAAVVDEIAARSEPLTDNDRILLQYGANQADLDPRRRHAARRIARRLAGSGGGGAAVADSSGGAAADLVPKAVVYLTRTDPSTGAPHLVVFDHVDAPEAGTQVPAGTVGDGEAVADAALREAFEETGLAGIRLVAALGAEDVDLRPYGIPAIARRHFFHATIDPDPDVVARGDVDVDMIVNLDRDVDNSGHTPPDRWRHVESDRSDGGPPVTFELYWAPLASPPVLAGELGARLWMVQRALLEGGP